MGIPGGTHSKRHNFRERPQQRMHGQLLLICTANHSVFTGYKEATAAATTPQTKYACRRLNNFGGSLALLPCIINGIIPTRRRLARNARCTKLLISKVRFTVGRNGT